MEQTNYPKSKKKWSKPDFILISSGYVEGGGPNVFPLEKSVASSFATPGGKFHFNTNKGGGGGTATSTVNHYHS